jgi:hypothetical protein
MKLQISYSRRISPNRICSGTYEYTNWCQLWQMYRLSTCLNKGKHCDWLYLRPASGCIRDGWVVAAVACCLGLLTFVLLLANSRRIVWGMSGSNLTPCCKKIEKRGEGKERKNWYLIKHKKNYKNLFLLQNYFGCLLVEEVCTCCV